MRAYEFVRVAPPAMSEEANGRAASSLYEWFSSTTITMWSGRLRGIPVGDAVVPVVGTGAGLTFDVAPEVGVGLVAGDVLDVGVVAGAAVPPVAGVGVCVAWTAAEGVPFAVGVELLVVAGTGPGERTAFGVADEAAAFAAHAGCAGWTGCAGCAACSWVAA